MKRILITIALIAGSGLSAENIIDYYNATGAGQAVVKKKGAYYTEICEELQKIDVDLKNGYFTFSDDCPGGGVSIQEVALFRNKAKEPFIAINHISRADGAVRGNTFHFYRKDGHKWKKADIGLKIGWQLFYPKKVKLTGNQYIDPSFPVSLPVTGTDLTVYAHVAGAKSIVKEMSLNPTEVNTMTIDQPLKYDKVILGWDAEKSVFYLKEKCTISGCKAASP